MFEQILKNQLGLKVVKEYKFHPTRRWRADYAILEHKIIIEVEGGVWTGGRHTSGVGFTKDMEKYNNATALGWSIIRVTPKTLVSGDTIGFIKDTIANKWQPKNN